MDRKEFNYCVKTAIRTKVLFPDGSIFKKRSGIISGTMGTLLINSLLNTIGCFTIMSMMEEIDEIDIDLMEHGDCNCVTSMNWLGDDFFPSVIVDLVSDLRNSVTCITNIFVVIPKLRRLLSLIRWMNVNI